MENIMINKYIAIKKELDSVHTSNDSYKIREMFIHCSFFAFVLFSSSFYLFYSFYEIFSLDSYFLSTYNNMSIFAVGHVTNMPDYIHVLRDSFVVEHVSSLRKYSNFIFGFIFPSLSCFSFAIFFFIYKNIKSIKLHYKAICFFYIFLLLTGYSFNFANVDYVSVPGASIKTYIGLAHLSNHTISLTILTSLSFASLLFFCFIFYKVKKEVKVKNNEAFRDKKNKLTKESESLEHSIKCSQFELNKAIDLISENDENDENKYIIPLIEDTLNGKNSKDRLRALVNHNENTKHIINE